MSFYQDAVTGLNSQPKWLSPKYFYDARGSHYFDLICKLDEYYPYRTEMALLPTVAEELDQWLPKQVVIVEFGAGSLHKIRPLLSTSQAIRGFIPIDISAEHLHNAGATLQQEFAQLEVKPAVGDFTQTLQLPHLELEKDNQRIPKLGFFPGSTLGNFNPDEAREFLRNARQSLGPDSMFLLGVDTQQDIATRERAYNDAKGVTASFNKNILVRMNRELSTNFKLDQFSHRAIFNRQHSRIEMHLVSDIEQQVTLGDKQIRFARGESIHTENSYKYTPATLAALVESAGWQLQHTWQAPNAAFSEVLLR